MLVLELARQARAPTNTVVSAGHVRDGRTGRCRFEAIGLRHHVSDLITAPTVSLDSDRVLVDIASVDHGLDTGQHALQSALSRITRRVDNVRHENQIAIADIVSWVNRGARSRITKSMQALRQLFIDVDDHRVLLFRIEVVGLEQKALQRHAVRVLETHQFRAAPVERHALSITIANLLKIFKARPGYPDIGKLIEA